MKRRKPIPRYIFGGTGHVCQARGGIVSKVSIPNISAKGCRVEGSGLPPVGQVCELVITWEGKGLRFEAEVKWKSRRGEAGLEFLSIDETRLLSLNQLFATLHLEPLRPLPPERAWVQET